MLEEACTVPFQKIRLGTKMSIKLASHNARDLLPPGELSHLQALTDWLREAYKISDELTKAAKT
jgi:hypothetical protein